MAETAQATDKGFGLAVLFTVLAVFGAVAMYVGAPEETSIAAAGFAGALIFGTVGIVAIHAHGA